MNRITKPFKRFNVSLYFSFYIFSLTGCIHLEHPQSDTLSYSYSSSNSNGSRSVSENDSITATDIEASQISATGETVFTASMGNIFPPGSGPTTLAFQFPSQSGGTPSSVKFVNFGTEYSLDISMGSQSSITVSSYGNTGSSIVGSFTLYLCENSINLAGGCSVDTVMTMTGSFSVTRKSNDSVIMP